MTYTLTNDNALGIAYHATTSAPTVINYTNHTYFNLAGEGSGDVYNQKLAINSNTFQPTDAMQIPTGFASVSGTPFDFRAMKPIGRNIERRERASGQPAGHRPRVRPQLGAPRVRLPAGRGRPGPG